MKIFARVGSIGRSNLLAQASRRCHLPPRPANSKACIKAPPRPARQGRSPPPAAVALPPPSAAVRPTSCSSTPAYARAPRPPVPPPRRVCFRNRYLLHELLQRIEPGFAQWSAPTPTEITMQQEFLEPPPRNSSPHLARGVLAGTGGRHVLRSARAGIVWAHRCSTATGTSERQQCCQRTSIVLAKPPVSECRSDAVSN